MSRVLLRAAIAHAYVYSRELERRRKGKKKAREQECILSPRKAVAMKYLSIKLSVEAHCTSMY